MGNLIGNTCSQQVLAIQDDRYKWLVFVALGVGMFGSVAEMGSTIVALPAIAGYFEIDLPAAQWILVAYFLTIAALLLPMGRVSDILGKKPLYIAGFTIFTVGALLAGLSTGFTILVLSRVIMGIGSAMYQGTSVAIMISAFPSAERGKAIGLHMSAVGMGGVAGWALGGVIVGAFGWRAVFLTNASFSIIATFAGMLSLRSSQSVRSVRISSFDWLGAVMSAGILVTFLLGMGKGARVGWTSPFVLAALIGAAILSIGFVWWELRTAVPMFDVRLFRSRIFSFGVASRFIEFVGLSSLRYLMPFYVQVIMGYSPKFFGLIAIPPAICSVVLAPVSGQLSDLFGRRKFVVGGLLLSAMSLFSLSALSIYSSIVPVIGAWVLQRIGMAVFIVPNSSLVLSTVERGSYGVTASFLNMVRNAGNITGTALATAIVAFIMISHGLPPKLASATARNTQEALEAFASGISTVYMVTGSLVFFGALLHYQTSKI